MKKFDPKSIFPVSGFVLVYLIRLLFQPWFTQVSGFLMANNAQAYFFALGLFVILGLMVAFFGYGKLETEARYEPVRQVFGVILGLITGIFIFSI